MLSIVLPTYNESKNLPELLSKLKGVLTVPHEIIVVDDNSPDRTWKLAEELKEHYHELRVLRRIGRRGLSSAVTEGFAMAMGTVLVVMDSDLQHDPSLVMRLYKAVEDGADIAVASRYIEGGSVGEWVTGRRLLSKTATWLAKFLPAVHSTDPMSGFFALKRSAYDRIARRLHPTGFKILLEILAALPSGSRITEIPLHFASRKHGESKLSMRVQMQFLLQLVRIAFMRFLVALGNIQIAIFLIVVAIILAVLVPRVWKLRMLYMNFAIRSQVQDTLQTTADKNGWLLSSMLVQEVAPDHVQILHVDYRRGADTEECLILPFDHSDPQPCIAAQ